MRPARKGPENAGDVSHGRGPAARFNEAGPQGAGKHGSGMRAGLIIGRFNEAGPQGAGKRPACRARERKRASFNEAGPQGAGKRARS